MMTIAGARWVPTPKRGWLQAALARRRAELAAATPPPAPTPPTTPAPAPPSPDFLPAAAERLYAARAQVTRQAGVDRLRALGGEPVPSSRPPAPTRDAPPAWPDPDEVYARRREDVRLAQQSSRSGR